MRLLLVAAAGAGIILDEDFNGPTIETSVWNIEGQAVGPVEVVGGNLHVVNTDAGGFWGNAAGVVDQCGEAVPGTDGRGVIELVGQGNVSLEGDRFPFPAWGELGFITVQAVGRPAPNDLPLYLYFWNARSDRYRSKVYMGSSPGANAPASPCKGSMK